MTYLNDLIEERQHLKERLEHVEKLLEESKDDKNLDTFYLSGQMAAMQAYLMILESRIELRQ